MSPPLSTYSSPNNGSLVPVVAALRKKIASQERKIERIDKKLHNKSRQATRAQNALKLLRDAKIKLKTLERVRRSRSLTSKDKAVKRAIRDARLIAGEFWLKDKKGSFKKTVRRMVRKLATLNVPLTRMNAVILTVAEGLSITVKDQIATRSCSRIIGEGGVLSEIQLVSEVEQAGGFTMSGDGTTLKHIGHEAKHITLQVPSYTPGPTAPNVKPKTRLLGVSIAPDHTSESQLAGWKSSRDQIYATYNASPLGQSTYARPTSFGSKIRGMGSDHAPDQKKLSRLAENWQEGDDILLRGEIFMEQADPLDILPTIFQENDKKIARAGGRAAWERLSKSKKQQYDVDTFNTLCQQFGKAQFEKLSVAERAAARRFVWAGCCMHKEMNSVKGGARAMTRFWVERKLTPPTMLMNRDNAAAAAAGPGKAREQAVDASEGGGVKLTALAGALFNNKDQKKGYGDTMRFFFENRIGYVFVFPDTSNTRFQSHCEAAIALLRHLPLYLEFLTLTKDAKTDRRFNHMELNVFNGLQDAPTLTELCVLALYAISVSHPYMAQVRTGDVNALDLGPLHAQVLSHCNKLIGDPNHVLHLDACHDVNATLDGKPFAEPEVWYSIQRLVAQGAVPDLRECLRAFMTGARDTWITFTEEYRSDGVIASLQTEKERSDHFIPATNDANEGIFGDLRQAKKMAPNLSIESFNARRMYKNNDTDKFEASTLCTDEVDLFARKAARERDASGEKRKMREDNTLHRDNVVKVKRARDVVRKTKADSEKDRLQLLSKHLDVEKLQSGVDRLGNTDLVAEINWHRQFDSQTDPLIPSKTLISKMRIMDKLQQLIIAVRRYHREQPRGDGISHTDSPEEQDDTVMDWEEREELEEATYMALCDVDES